MKSPKQSSMDNNRIPMFVGNHQILINDITQETFEHEEDNAVFSNFNSNTALVSSRVKPYL
jgi:hypothetical protein